MDLSMKWLNEYVDMSAISPQEYSDAMTMSGSKVEGYEQEGEGIKNVVVGKVLSIAPHPDADKLVVCQIDVGEKQLQIVTGAKNLKEGDIVPVALDNSEVFGGKKIKKGKLRGVESNGMLCSLGELGLTVHDFPYAIEDGIFVLEEECELGQDIHEAIGLNDTCVEFEITPNRPDCLSVIGLARETAATFGRELKLHTPVVKGSEGDVNQMVSAEIIDTDLCSRYMARAVKNVKIAPSPRWMRERLRASGVRPINNIVDITNYVMLEYGQPMHAFDARFLKGNQIRVRRAKSGETITTLDGVERTLNDSMLVIADAEKPVAVAGVMGGEYSGIMDDTNTILFESACFDGASVRVTARALGMRTDASSRYEKGLDPENCAGALERACELVELLGAGEVIGGVIDCNRVQKPQTVVRLEPEWINRFLGTDISRERMVEILLSVGFEVKGDDIFVPSYRGDVEHKADIAEEIARFYGYNNITTTEPRGCAQGIVTEEQLFERTAVNTLLAQGYYQILSYSFISPKYYDKICLPADSPLRKSVIISNPLGEDTSVMRTTALPSMLENLARNYNNRAPEAALFELATEYIPQGDDVLPLERKKLLAGAFGQGRDYYTLKGAVEALLSSLCIADWEFEVKADHPSYHPGRTALLTAGGEPLGIVGEIHPKVLENYGIDVKVCVADLDLCSLMRHAAPERSYKPMPRFPAVTRDLALVCDKALPVIRLQKAIQRGGGKLLEEVSLFDVYEGEHVAPGKKSVAYSLTLRAPDRTLTDEECAAALKKVMRELEKEGAVLRS